MQYVLKLTITVAVILLCTIIGRKLPSLAGLIAVMPLTGLLVLFWLSHENRNNPALLLDYTKGALWGILPTIAFYAVLLLCFVKKLPLIPALAAGFGVWLAGALVHQWLVR